MKKLKALHMIAFILLVVGGLNWGLVGLFDYNLVNAILGNWEMLERLVYILVGLAAVWEVLGHKKNCRMCTSGASA